MAFPKLKWPAKTLARILDENFSPVARFRLLSQGIYENNRLRSWETVVGDKGCLSCGDCVDACPVVQMNYGPVYLQNHRTSMALENMVDDLCRRCYRCIRVCPQVVKPLKDFALGFRRGERILHIFYLSILFLLASSGFTLFHYREIWPASTMDVISIFHRSVAPLFLLGPLVYLWLDRQHFRRALGRIFHWGRQDARWVKDSFFSLLSKREGKPPYEGEFNPYQKFWYLYLLTIASPIFLVTGILTWVGTPSLSRAVVGWASLVHAGTAMVTDILVATHVYHKVVHPWLVRVARIMVTFAREGSFSYEMFAPQKILGIGQAGGARNYALNQSLEGKRWDRS